MIFGFNPSKCKTHCRLGVGRIKLLRNKKLVALKGLRKEVAELLRQGKQGNARIRVEAVMREHNMLQAFEVLELYLELLAVRVELLAKTKDIPQDMIEAVSSLIYAGERVSTDLAEVAVVSKMLVSKYSPVYKANGFPDEVVSDLTCRKWEVNETVMACLAVAAPLPEQKLQFLADIAAEHGVEFDADTAALDMLPGGGRPAAAAPAFAAVDPLPPGGAGVPPLAQGWVPPPSAGAPPAAGEPPAPAQQPGWQPPGAAAGAAAGHVSRVLSGGSVVVRGGAGAAPGATPTPAGAAAPPPATGPGWSPPAPEDVDRHGRAFQSHVGAAAAWRQTKLHGASPASSPDVSQRSAAADAYPPPAAGGAAPLPVPGTHTAASSGGSTTPSGDRPQTPMGSYADASAAAEAAKRYSQMAQAAARRAEEFAAGQSAAGPGTGTGTPGSPGSPGDGGDGGSGGGFVPRSTAEIQRAYDAAPGPPSKSEAQAPGPPSAPPALPPPAPAAPQPPAADGDLDLPSVPSAPSAAPGVQDELDELTKRFEALKRR